MTEDNPGDRDPPGLRTRLRSFELPAPEWIVELVRPQPARVPWLDVARAAIVITTALAAISIVSARISVPGAISSLAGLQLLVFTVIGSGIQAPLPPLQTSLVF